MALKLKTSDFINLDMIRFLYQDVEIEKSDMGMKSIDAVKRSIMTDVESEFNSQDPYRDGVELNLEKEFN